VFATPDDPPYRPAASRAALLGTSARRYRPAVAGALLLLAFWTGVVLFLWLVPIVASTDGMPEAAAAAVFYHQHDRSLSAEALRLPTPPRDEE